MSIEVVVTAIVAEAHGIKSFVLSPLNGVALPPYEAGAHVDVVMAGGLTRQYSLLRAHQHGEPYRIAVLHDPASRGGSAHMHQSLREGDRLTISTPKNLFALVADAPHAVLIAGGIGITPIMCMAEALHRQNRSFEMHYCSRSPQHAAFHGFLQASVYADKIGFYFDAENKIDVAAILAQRPEGSMVYTCGPEGLIEHVYAVAAGLSVPESALHREVFQQVISNEGNQAFTLQLAKQGLSFIISPDQTVLDVLQAHDIEIDVSCEQGICGTCVTRVISGEVDHKDAYLTDQEKASNSLFTPCCSRAKSPLLVIDL